MVDGRASAEPTNRKNIWKSKSSLKRKRRKNWRLYSEV
jgi:hypothetical protein